MELLPPAPTDKLVAWCKVFGHEWTNYWELTVMSREIPIFIRGMYKLCLRCSEYRWE